MAIPITRAEYEKKFGTQPAVSQPTNTSQTSQQQIQQPKQGLLQKSAGVADALFGGGKVGEAIGTGIAKLRATPEQRQFIDPGPSKGQVLGSALQSAALFTPVGKVAKTITGGAKAFGLAKGVSALGKIGSGLVAGEAFDVANNLQQGKTGTAALAPGSNTAIGGAIPAAGAVKNMAVRFSERQAPRIINSLIKPLAKDFSYGKNPGRAVAEEKIIANSFEDLAEGIRSSRQKIGQQIGDLGEKLSKSPQINIKNALFPLDEAMKTAASQNNPTLLQRLSKVKEAVMHRLEPGFDEAGNIVIKKAGQRNLDKLTFQEVRDVLGEIGDMTQFTGNPSDDKLVNSALKRVYGGIKGSSLEYARAANPALAKEFERLTERYADLTSAEVATKYRDKIAERANLIGLSPTVAGLGSGILAMIATGGAATPAVAAGLAGAAMDKLASTPAFKTRVAALLSKKSPEEARMIFQKIPALRKLFPKGSPVSPGDRLLQTKAGQAVEKGITDYAQNPKLGASISSITPESVAKRVDGRDLGLIREALKRTDLKSSMRVQPMLKAMGIESMELSTQKRFLREVLELSTKKLKVK